MGLSSNNLPDGKESANEYGSVVGLIVNADDFGLTEGVNDGIVEAHTRGILSSTTIMANMPAFEHAVALAKQHPALGVGVHVNLCMGSPAAARAELRGLIEPDGSLPSTMKLLVKAWNPAMRAPIEAEIRAQIKKTLEAGVEITHLDSHKHVMVHPTIMAAAISAAKEFGIRAIRIPMEDASFAAASPIHRERKARIRTGMVTLLAGPAKSGARRAGLTTTDRFFGIAGTGNWEPQSMARAIVLLRPGTTELMVHPGLIDDDLRGTATRLVNSRLEELEALTSPEVRAAVEEAGVKLITFRDL